MLNKVIVSLAALVMVVLLIYGIGISATAEFDDVSARSEYSSLVGSSYITNKDLLIYGYTRGTQPDAEIDGYSIYDFPGVAGREFVSEDVLPKGTIFTILQVLECSNCFPFPSYRKFIISIETSESYQQHQVHFSDPIFALRGLVWREM